MFINNQILADNQSSIFTLYCDDTLWNSDNRPVEFNVFIEHNNFTDNKLASSNNPDAIYSNNLLRGRYLDYVKIEDNIFINNIYDDDTANYSNNNIICMDNDQTLIMIENNTFLEQEIINSYLYISAINFGGYQQAAVTFTNNNFLTYRNIISYVYYYGINVVPFAIHNYFGTDDAEIIQSKIYDACHLQGSSQLIKWWPYYINAIDMQDPSAPKPAIAFPNSTNDRCAGIDIYPNITNGTKMNIYWPFDDALTVSNSPYYVINNVEIPANTTIEIENGVEIIFLGDYTINIYGEFDACNLYNTLSITDIVGLVDNNTYTYIHGDFQQTHIGKINYMTDGIVKFCNVKFENMYYSVSRRYTMDNCEVYDCYYGTYDIWLDDTFSNITDTFIHDVTSINYGIGVIYDRCILDTFTNFIGGVEFGFQISIRNSEIYGRNIATYCIQIEIWHFLSDYVYNNIIDGCVAGIYVSDIGDDIISSIHHNNITNCQWGIYYRKNNMNQLNSTIEYNNIYNCSIGIFMYHTAHNTIIQYNNIGNCTDKCLEIRPNNVLAQYNNFSECNEGIRSNGYYNVMQYNNFVDSQQYSIYIAYSLDTIQYNHFIHDKQYAIYDRQDNTLIKENIFFESEYISIYVVTNEGGTIIGNTFINNYVNGLINIKTLGVENHYTIYNTFYHHNGSAVIESHSNQQFQHIAYNNFIGNTEVNGVIVINEGINNYIYNNIFDGNNIINNHVIHQIVNDTDFYSIEVSNNTFIRNTMRGIFNHECIQSSLCPYSNFIHNNVTLNYFISSTNTNSSDTNNLLLFSFIDNVNVEYNEFCNNRDDNIKSTNNYIYLSEINKTFIKYNNFIESNSINSYIYQVQYITPSINQVQYNNFYNPLGTVPYFITGNQLIYGNLNYFDGLNDEMFISFKIYDECEYFGIGYVMFWPWYITPINFVHANITNNLPIEYTANITIGYCRTMFPSTSPTTAMPTPDTVTPTLSPTQPPTMPTSNPTDNPTVSPTKMPTSDPTGSPTHPTILPTASPTEEPTLEPSLNPTQEPTIQPTGTTDAPTKGPTDIPTYLPTTSLTSMPTKSSESTDSALLYEFSITVCMMSVIFCIL